MDSSLRYFGTAVGFGVGAVWMTLGFGPAIVCLLLAALGYGAVFVAERAQANVRNGVSRDKTQDEALELEDGRYEPTDDAASPLAAEAEYGWPWPTEKPGMVGTESR